MAGVTTRAEATHRRDPDEPVSYWLREPGPAMDPPLEAGETLEVDVAIVGGGFTGLWTAIALTDTDPALRVAVLEAETVAFGASGRNGGFCEASLTHGLANGIRHFPDELDAPRARGRRQPPGADRVHPRARHRLRPRGDRDPVAGGPAVPGRGVPGLGRRGRGARRAPRVPGPGGGPGRGPLPALAGGALPAAGPRRRARPGQALPRDRPGRPRARRARPRGHGRDPPASAGPGGVLVRTGVGRRRCGRARSWSPPRPTRPGCAAWGRCSCRSTTTSSCLGAARPPTSGGPSAGRGARACPTRTTSSTTSGSPPTTGSCGAATTPSTTRAAGSGRSSTGGRPRSRSSRRSSSAPSRSSRACASRTAGAARSTRPRGSRSRSARRWAAG